LIVALVTPARFQALCSSAIRSHSARDELGRMQRAERLPQERQVSPLGPAQRVVQPIVLFERVEQLRDRQPIGADRLAAGAGELLRGPEEPRLLDAPGVRRPDDLTPAHRVADKQHGPRPAGRRVDLPKDAFLDLDPANGGHQRGSGVESGVAR
jgi:hypothetical protein